MTTRFSEVRRDSCSMEPLLRRLSAYAPFDEPTRQLVEGLGRRVEIIPARATIQTEGEAPLRPRYILTGWACRQRLLSDGRRQIFGLLLPGDGIGVCPDHSVLALATTVAVTPVTCADASPLQDARSAEEHPAIAAAQLCAMREDEARLLDHVVRLGRQTAYERLAHLLLELHARLSTAGAAEDYGFEFPLTQEVLADVLGLSVVHVNRTLQQFRRERLVELRSSRLKLLKPELLAAIADFRLVH